MISCCAGITRATVAIVPATPFDACHIEIAVTRVDPIDQYGPADCYQRVVADEVGGHVVAAHARNGPPKRCLCF